MLIKNLTITYGKSLIIKDFSLEVKAGDKLIIAGPNGCGKTTLLKAILGIIKPFSGEIVLDNDESIAYCKQDFPKEEFPITVKEVVSMGIKGNRSVTKSERSVTEQKIDAALEKAGVLDLKNRLFYSLSGGQRQKVSLARCYCQNAKLWLLDEPSSFLDSESKRAFTIQMKALEKENFSIIAVTHDEEIIKELGWKTIRGEKWNA